MNKPTDSVRIVMFNADDPAQFLILAEADDPENWKLPGGKFDSVDETPEAAAKRELAEELRLDTSVVPLEQVGALTNDDGVSARYIFTATVGGEQPAPTAEIAAIQWDTEGTLPDGPNKGHILSAVAQARSATQS